MRSRHGEYLQTLPPEWPLVPVRSVGEVVSGSTPSRALPSNWNGDIAWVTPGELTSLRSKYLMETRDHLTRTGLSACSSGLLPVDTLLVTTRATVGVRALAGVRVATNQGFKSIVFNGEAEPSFYYHLFDLLPSELVRLASGTTFLEISGREFKEILVPRPPGEEQRRIAAILDTLDDAINRTERVIAKLQQMKQGLLHDLLTRGVDEHGELRPPPDEAPHLYKDSPLGKIPRGWQVSTVAQEFEVQLGKMLSKVAMTGRYFKPYLNNKAVQWDYVDTLDLPLMDFSVSEQARFNLLPGDLLVCEGGEAGRTAMWRGELGDCYFQKAVHRLRPTSGYHPSLMLRFMRFAAEYGLFTKFTSQTSIAHLTREKLSVLPLPLPPQVEQEQLAAKFDGVDRALWHEEEVVAKLRTLKHGLLHDLLTGRVRTISKTEEH